MMMELQSYMWSVRCTLMVRRLDFPQEQGYIILLLLKFCAVYISQNF